MEIIKRGRKSVKDEAIQWLQKNAKYVANIKIGSGAAIMEFTALVVAADVVEAGFKSRSWFPNASDIHISQLATMVIDGYKSETGGENE